MDPIGTRGRGEHILGWGGRKLLGFWGVLGNPRDAIGAAES